MKIPFSKGSQLRVFWVIVILLLLAACVLITLAVIGYPGTRSGVIKQRGLPEVFGIEFPGTGVWNGFNEQLNIIECNNLGGTTASLRFVVLDAAGKILGERGEELPRFGTTHIVLNSYPGIADNYGTYRVEALSLEPVVRCYTMVYRRNQAQDGQETEYAYSIPVASPLVGVSSGVYNSLNPEGEEAGAVYNWLSVYNPGAGGFEDTLFDGVIEVFDQRGVYKESIDVTDLRPGERRDFALGHPYGQVTGLYRIIPRRAAQPYGAFLSRYSHGEDGAFRFGFPLFAEQGLFDSGSVPASTMGPALNWGEVANISDEDLEVEIEIRSKDNEVLLRETRAISARSQHHIFLNQYIGEENVGFFRVRELTGGEDGLGRLLVQSLYYGYPSGDPHKISWAYASQAEDASGSALRGEEGEEGEAEFVFPINTFGAANWLKVFNPGERTVSMRITIYSQNGEEIAADYPNRLSPGAADYDIHRIVGQGFVGTLILSVSSDKATAEMIRVYPERLEDTSGGMRRTASRLLRGDEWTGAVPGMIMKIPGDAKAGGEVTGTGSPWCLGYTTDVSKLRCCDEALQNENKRCSLTEQSGLKRCQSSWQWCRHQWCGYRAHNAAQCKRCDALYSDCLDKARRAAQQCLAAAQSLYQECRIRPSTTILSGRCRPRVTTTPAGQEQGLNESARFSAQVTTDKGSICPRFAYAWRLRRAGGGWQLLRGQTGSSLTLTMQKDLDGAEIQAGVSASSISQTWGSSAFLRLSKCTLKFVREPENEAGVLGGRVTFSAEVLGTNTSYCGQTAFQWFEGTPVKSKAGTYTWKAISGATKNSLIVSVTAQRAGLPYKLRASNKRFPSGIESKLVSYTVNSACDPVILEGPYYATVAEGDEAIFSVNTRTESGCPVNSFQWYRAAHQTGPWRALSGETRSALRFEATRDLDNTWYRVQIRNTGSSKLVISEASRLSVSMVFSECLSLRSDARRECCTAEFYDSVSQCPMNDQGREECIQPLRVSLAQCLRTSQCQASQGESCCLDKRTSDYRECIQASVGHVDACSQLFAQAAAQCPAREESCTGACLECWWLAWGMYSTCKAFRSDNAILCTFGAYDAYENCADAN